MKEKDIRCRLGWALVCLALTASTTAYAKEPGALEPPRSINAPDAPARATDPGVPTATTQAVPPAEAEKTLAPAVPAPAASASQTPVQPESPQPAAAATSPVPALSDERRADEATRRGPVTRRTAESPPPPWRPGSFTVGFMAGGVHRVDDGYREFAEDGLWGQGGLFAAYDAAINPWLRIGGELQWSLSFVDEEGQSGAPDRSLYEHRAVASAVLSAVALPNLWPHLRLGAGSSMSKVRYAPQEGLFLIDQWRVVPLLDLALGATYHVPLRRAAHTLGLALGVRLELGYVIAGSRQLSQDKGERFDVKTGLGALGSLRPSGAYLRAALLVRFWPGCFTNFAASRLVLDSAGVLAQLKIRAVFLASRNSLRNRTPTRPTRALAKLPG